MSSKTRWFGWRSMTPALMPVPQCSDMLQCCHVSKFNCKIIAEPFLFDIAATNQEEIRETNVKQIYILDYASCNALPVPWPQDHWLRSCPMKKSLPSRSSPGHGHSAKMSTVYSGLLTLHVCQCQWSMPKSPLHTLSCLELQPSGCSPSHCSRSTKFKQLVNVFAP